MDQPLRYMADSATIHELMRQLESPEQAEHAAGVDGGKIGLRHILADALDEHGRTEESRLLREPGFIVARGGRIYPHFIQHQVWNHHQLGRREEFTKPTLERGDTGRRIRERNIEDWYAAHHPELGGWFWENGESHDEEYHEDHPNYEPFPGRRDGRISDCPGFNMMPMTPAEIAYMHHHAQTPEFRQ